MSDLEQIDMGKRKMFTFGGSPVPQPQKTVPKAPRPPYALEESMFARLCDGCGDCVSACPSQIIELVNGVATLDISYSACDLCGKCQSACHTLALANSSPRTGLIATISNSCDNLYGYCANCEESCDFGALQWHDDLKPNINADKCIGCGQCAQSCYTSMISFALR